MPLPASIQYGYVVWTALLAVADTTADPDRTPDAVPATGEIRFDPLVSPISTTSPAVTIVPQRVVATLDSEGRLIDPTGQTGVWLVTGQYTVTFAFSGFALPSFRIEVTAAHTEEAPLDLTLAAPLVPNPATVFVVNQQVYTDTLAARDAATVARDTATAAAADAEATASGMVVSGTVSGDDLVLSRADGSTVPAGNVRGPKGDKGDAGDVGPEGPAGASWVGQLVPPVGGLVTSSYWITNTTSGLRSRNTSPMPLLFPQTVQIDQARFNVTVLAATAGQTAKVELVRLNAAGTDWDLLQTLGTGISLTDVIGEKIASFAPITLTAGVTYGVRVYEEQAFDSALRVTQGLIVGPGVQLAATTGYANHGLPVGTNTSLVTGVPVVRVRRSA